VSASGEVDAAARDAARQASLQLTYADAEQAAKAAVQADLGGVCQVGAPPAVTLFVNGTAVTGTGAGAAWAAGAQALRVSFTCNVNLKAFSLIGIPASKTLPGSADAPLDQFSPRSAG
jgi:hypothetical protein